MVCGNTLRVCGGFAVTDGRPLCCESAPTQGLASPACFSPASLRWEAREGDGATGWLTSQEPQTGVSTRGSGGTGPCASSLTLPLRATRPLPGVWGPGDHVGAFLPLVVSSVQSITCVPTLRPHALQHARLPCPSPTPRAYPTHVHWVGDVIQPSHLSSPSPPALNLPQHQGLFRWVCSLHQVAKVLELQLQHQSFQWIFRTDVL